MLEEARVGGNRIAREQPVGLRHQRHCLGFAGDLTSRQQGFHAHHHGGLNAQRDGRSARQQRGQGGAFGLAAKVQAVRDAQRPQGAVVVWRETGEVIRAVHQPAAYAPSVCADVTAEIAKVGSALQHGWGVWVCHVGSGGFSP